MARGGGDVGGCSGGGSGLWEEEDMEAFIMMSGAEMPCVKSVSFAVQLFDDEKKKTKTKVRSFCEQVQKTFDQRLLLRCHCGVSGAWSSLLLRFDF